MKDGHQFDDNYAVEPAAMSDEQIARRDAMSIVELADNAAATSVSLNALLEQVCRQVERLQRERDEMQSVLRELMSIEPTAYRNMDGTSVVHISKSLIERAEKLLAGG